MASLSTQSFWPKNLFVILFSYSSSNPSANPTGRSLEIYRDWPLRMTSKANTILSRQGNTMETGSPFLGLNAIFRYFTFQAFWSHYSFPLLHFMEDNLQKLPPLCAGHVTLSSIRPYLPWICAGLVTCLDQQNSLEGIICQSRAKPLGGLAASAFTWGSQLQATSKWWDTMWRKGRTSTKTPNMWVVKPS